MTLDDLTVNFSHLKAKTILEDWYWFIGKNKLPILLTASGDAFVQDKKNLAIHFLDVSGGDFYQVAETIEEFNSLLGSKEFVTKYFSVQMVGELLQLGRKLEKGKVFSFKILPMLGGKYELSNVEETNIPVHYSVSGQIYQQCHDLPDGAPIGNITLKQPRKWWKFWG